MTAWHARPFYVWAQGNTAERWQLAPPTGATADRLGRKLRGMLDRL